jgi:hypothetical protein
LHDFPHAQENARAKSFLLRSSGGTAAEYASSLDLAAFPLALDLRKVLPTREIRREEFKFWLQREDLLAILLAISFCLGS